MWQCRNQAEHMARDTEFLERFDAWTDELAAFVRAKGKVPPGKYRAFGYDPPKHRWADAKLWWRDRRMRLGFPMQGTSPEIQRDMGLNRDDTVHPGEGEGEKLRR